MKIVALSDMHGDLPIIEDPCDVICICGDIVPLETQRDYTRSVAWIAGRFSNWCDKLDCEKILLISGNHDFVFERLYNEQLNVSKDVLTKESIDECFPSYVETVLDLPGKVNYLQNSYVIYDGVKFYGTPNIPELRNWAFYQKSDELLKTFRKIPDDTDVLLTHSPGKYVNDTGVSLQLSHRPEYGSIELTKAVQDKHIKYWFCGHVHSGNHRLEKYNGIKVANVSLKDENYNTSYDPLTVEFDVNQSSK